MKALETLHTLEGLTIGRDLVLRDNTHLGLHRGLQNSFHSIGRDAEVKDNNNAGSKKEDASADVLSEEEIVALLPVGGYAYVSSNQGK